MLSRVAHHQHGCHLPGIIGSQQFSQAWVPHHSASLPGHREPLGRARQGDVVGGDADRRVVLLGRLVVRARHRVDIDDNRRLQNLLPDGIGPALVAGVFQLKF